MRYASTPIERERVVVRGPPAPDLASMLRSSSRVEFARLRSAATCKVVLRQTMSLNLIICLLRAQGKRIVRSCSRTRCRIYALPRDMETACCRIIGLAMAKRRCFLQHWRGRRRFLQHWRGRRSGHHGHEERGCEHRRWPVGGRAPRWARAREVEGHDPTTRARKFLMVSFRSRARM